MGNCKSAFGSSESPSSSIRAQKTLDIKRRRKSIHSLSRVILFAKRNNKVAPADANANSSGSDFPSSQRLHEIFCRPSISPNQRNHDQFSSKSNSELYHAEHPPQAMKPLLVDNLGCCSTECYSDDQDLGTTGDVIDQTIAPQKQIQSTDSSISVQQESTIDSVVPQISEKLLKLRKTHIGKHMVNEIQELSTIQKKLKKLQEHQNDCHNDLLLLKAVRARTASVSRKASKLNVSIKKLHKAYRKDERRLYKVRAERAVCVANVDRFLTKLYPAVKYTDIYSKRHSFYLSPIPEESDTDVEEYEMGIFPSEINTSLAAVTLRQDQLFLDASPSSHY